MFVATDVGMSCCGFYCFKRKKKLLFLIALLALIIMNMFFNQMLSQHNDTEATEIDSALGLPNQFTHTNEITVEIILIQVQIIYIIYKTKTMLKRLISTFELLLCTIKNQYTLG